MGSSPKTKLAGLKIFTHPQVIGFSENFFNCGGQVHRAIFTEGLCCCLAVSAFSLLLYLFGTWELLIPWWES